MSLFFNNCDIIVNGSGILAESANLNSSNQVFPFSFIGFKDTKNFPAGAIQSNFDVSYILETQNEPIYSIVQFLRTGYDNFNFTPNTIVAGGITGFFYLQNYKLNLEPNKTIKVNASFVGFVENSGTYDSKNTQFYNHSTANTAMVSFTKDVISENILKKQVVPGGNFNIYNLNYGFEADWQPEYIVGKKQPIQVQLNQISENLDLTVADFKKINYSGEKFESYFNNAVHSLFINATTGVGSLEIPLTGFVLKSEKSAMQGDNLVYQNLSFLK